ncbi:hypothetical protein FS749_009908 [Ceratobasidium sp. UAMH 11750]|nr:hypothetical protein FS749_009908 [Ceratobasidium sp. UAMH 11750]
MAGLRGLVIRVGLIIQLLATTRLYRARWHPVVAVILWQSIPMAVCSFLHYPLHKPLREHLPIIPAERPLDQQHTPLAYFCAVDAIFIYIFGAIGSGLTVSLTLSLFSVVVKSGNPGLHSAPRTWLSFRWLWDPTTTALCVGPFIWALPIIGAAIETLVRTSRAHYPSIYYSYTYCNIDDYQYQLISATILGLPLIVSVGLILVTLILIARIYIRDRAASRSINVPLAFRFMLIVLQTFIMAIILICEICLKDDQLKGVHRFHLYWTALVPLILFVVFGTQNDLLNIWRYWAYRMIGREPTFTPRSSNEAATLSNSSGPATTVNGRFVVSTTAPPHRNPDTLGRKAHRASSSAGESILDPPDLFATKNTTDLHHNEVVSNPDLELALSPTNGKQTRQASPLAFPVLPYAAETPTPLPNANIRRVDFYSAAADTSSQGLASTISHSGGHGSLASHRPRSDRPFIVVTDGFGAVFGAQIPAGHGRMMGRPIISPQERDRRLAVPTAPRRPSFNGGNQVERRRSVGLPPPPRSPRQSIVRPISAGGTGMLECGTGERGGPVGVSVTTPTPVATAWGWDSPFSPVGRSAPLVSSVTRGSDSGNGSHDLDGIEMQEHLKPPSNGSFEHEVTQRSSQEQHSNGWARASRVSVASDRTFG